MAYWLFKTEPDVFGLHHLKQKPEQTARWDEVRNYQARNFLRDQVKFGDTVFIYHSQCKPTAIVGLAEVVSAPYPDPSQFDQTSDYFDAKSSTEKPKWFCVDIRFEQEFLHPITLSDIKNAPELSDMVLVKQGRLSVQPVTQSEAKLLLKWTKQAKKPA